MRVCKYLKQSVRKIDEQNGNYFKCVSKIKQKKTSEETHMRLITQFKSSYYLYLLQKKAWENASSRSKDI